MFGESKWQDKVQGYEKLTDWLFEEGIPLDMIEHSFRFIKGQQRDWKESNMNLIKAALNHMNKVIDSAHRVGKRSAGLVIPYFAEKIGDVKYKGLCAENLLLLAEHVSPGFVLKALVKHGMTIKNPKVLQELATMIETFLKEFGPGGFPLQEVIAFAVQGCSASNPKVREANIKMIVAIYSYVGDPIRDFLKDVKESTMKVIKDEFEKVTPNTGGAPKSTRQV